VSGTVLERLAEYAAAEREAALAPALRHHAQRALVDWFGNVLRGATVPPASLLAAALADELGQGGAFVYGAGARAPLRVAALINGTASHAIEFDDIFRDAIYHPGSPTVAAALAAAQARDADAELMLRAIVVGYEVSTRIGVAVQPSHYAFWHTTGTIGSFGAAAAVATVLRLDAPRIAHALATAATMAAGLQQAFRSASMSKPLHAGHAAEAGALAALAAARGVTGALDMLEGAAGFGAAMSRGADWRRATEELGSRYNIAEMTYKNHGCCGHAFAAIDGALALKAANGLLPEAIATLRIGTYKAALEVAGDRAAATASQARFSLPFLVASALVHGAVRLDAFEPPRLADPRVRALMGRIELAVDDACDAAFPRRRAARIDITLADGRQLSRFQPTRKGDPELPLSDRELDDKFLELAGPAIGEAPARRLLARLWSLDQPPAALVPDAAPRAPAQQRTIPA
jgi:2-methylcitrate dehydratase PrpD